MAQFRFPKNTQRVGVIGRTGSGKTQFGTWLLSHAHFDKQPYIIVDYKNDDLLNDIEHAKHIEVGEIPKKNGIYICHPHPAQEEEVEKFLWKIWERERIGLYFDEAYMVAKSNAFNAILTQGRSKRIPVIWNTQRPAWITRFCFSESDYFAIFHLNDRRDQKKVEEFTPHSIESRLPDYHSRWFDVGSNEIFILQPVPERDKILERFSIRLKPKRGFL